MKIILWKQFSFQCKNDAFQNPRLSLCLLFAASSHSSPVCICVSTIFVFAFRLLLQLYFGDFRIAKCLKRTERKMRQRNKRKEQNVTTRAKIPDSVDVFQCHFCAIIVLSFIFACDRTGRSDRERLKTSFAECADTNHASKSIFILFRNNFVEKFTKRNARCHFVVCLNRRFVRLAIIFLLNNCLTNMLFRRLSQNKIFILLGISLCFFFMRSLR